MLAARCAAVFLMPSGVTMSRRRNAWIMAGVLLSAASWANAQTPATPQALRWNADTLGNHRYLLQVDAPASAVRVLIPWRRRDAHPEQVAVIVTGPDGKPVANVLRGKVDRAAGELVFEAAQAGTYAVYYQPYVSTGRSNYPTVNYATPKDTADATWARKIGVGARAWQHLPQ